MSKPSNEQLCALAQKGDTHATNLLLEYNSGLINALRRGILILRNINCLPSIMPWLKLVAPTPINSFRSQSFWVFHV